MDLEWGGGGGLDHTSITTFLFLSIQSLWAGHTVHVSWQASRWNLYKVSFAQSWLYMGGPRGGRAGPISIHVLVRTVTLSWSYSTCVMTSLEMEPHQSKFYTILCIHGWTQSGGGGWIILVLLHSCSCPYSHCELVIQYMCHDKLRDGTSTK